MKFCFTRFINFSLSLSPRDHNNLRCWRNENNLTWTIRTRCSSDPLRNHKHAYPRTSNFWNTTIHISSANFSSARGSPSTHGCHSNKDLHTQTHLCKEASSFTHMHDLVIHQNKFMFFSKKASSRDALIRSQRECRKKMQENRECWTFLCLCE